MTTQFVNYSGVTARWKLTRDDTQVKDNSTSGYLIPSELHAAISNRDIQNAVYYVLARTDGYRDYPKAAATQCLAVIVAIYDRLGAEDAFRFFKGQQDTYACCAQILEILTDVVINSWPVISQQLRVSLLTALLNDISVKSYSMPDDVRIDTGYKLKDRSPNTELALEYHPFEMMIILDMLEKLRHETELAYYQEELGSLESPPEWTRDFSFIELEGLSGILRSMMRREARYRPYADWRRGTGFEWKIYLKPKDDLTNWEVLEAKERTYDFAKKVLTYKRDIDEDRVKALEKTMNYLRYMALRGEFNLQQLHSEYRIANINTAQKNELFDIIIGTKGKGNYDMEPVNMDFDDLQASLRVSKLTKSILRFIAG